jgi:hypothetical protein
MSPRRVRYTRQSQERVLQEVRVNMRDEDESVSIAVNGKRVRSGEHRGAVSGVMSVMRDARALGKLGGCSEEVSRDGARWGVCERAC